MSQNNNNSGGGGGLMTILFVVFLVLKLTGTIDWSWWWVTSPLWIGFGLIAVFTLLTLILGVAIIGTSRRR